MVVVGSNNLQALPEGDLPPDYMGAIVQYLRANPVLQAVIKPQRIASKLQDPAGMPEPAITFLSQSGFGRSTDSVPDGWHFVDMWCYGASGFLAHKLCRIVERILLPPQGPVGFVKNGCRINDIVWPGERYGQLEQKFGGWEFYFVALQIHKTAVALDVADTPPIVFAGVG